MHTNWVHTSHQTDMQMYTHKAVHIRLMDVQTLNLLKYIN